MGPLVKNVAIYGLYNCDAVTVIVILCAEFLWPDGTQVKAGGGYGGKGIG